MKRIFLFLCGTLLLPATMFAQYASKNVNMVSGTEWPGGDPFLQRQNEPSLGVSTRNPLHLLAGANDYRTVDLPGLPDDEETGDAWLGWFKSFDGGFSWLSGLIPGYPQDPAKTLPLYGFKAGADPMVRPGFNGMLYYSGLALNRVPAVSAVFVARFNDFNNLERGDSIKHLGTSIVFDGRPGNVFADKPSLAVDFPRFGQSVVCSAGGQTILGGNVYVTYTIVNAAQTVASLWFSRSTDCGSTWSTPISMSGNSTLNQGSVMAVDTRTGTVYVAWRRIAPAGPPQASQTQAIMLTKSTDFGKTFSTPVVVRNITPFEQGTTGSSIRTRAYPTLATDANGRIYIAWSERLGSSATGDGRIMLTSSSDGTAWSAPVMVAPNPGRGHQFMPALSFSSSKLMLVYYDLREDSTLGRFKPDPIMNGAYVETRRALGNLALSPQRTDIVFTPYVQDAVPAPLIGSLLRRHTLDVRATQATPGPLSVFSDSQRVSRYQFGSTAASPIDPETGRTAIDQMGLNPPNLPMFKLGTVPFFGDYIDLSPQYPFLGSIFNNLPLPPPAFHAVWTDNRDVHAPRDGNWANYTPVGLNGASKFDPNQPAPPCVVGQTGLRNQNIYTSRITSGVFVGSPGNAKQTGRIQRAFVVLVQNTKAVAQSYRLQIANQPIGGKASFIQFPLNAPAVTTLDVTVNAKSSTSRPVFVTSLLAKSPVGVIVSEITGAGGTVPPNALTSATVLNGDVTNPDIGNSNPVGNPDIGNAEVYNPDIGNSLVANPDIGNSAISTPDIGNSDPANPDIGNTDLGNPDIGNTDVPNPDIGNTDLGNPDIGNDAIANGSMSDTTWDVNNTGNTTSSYSVKLLQTGAVPAGYKLQLLLHYPYRTPVADGCTLKTRRHDNLINNQPNPTLTQPADNNLGNPDIGNATIPTLSIPPGDSARLTVRVVDPFHKNVTIDASRFLTPVIIAHAINTADLTNPNARPPISLVITTSSLPNGAVGASYPATTMNAIGGAGAYTWSLVGIDGPSYTGFPPGLTLSPGGVITGTPTSAGTYRFTIRVTDSATPTAHVASRSFVVNVTNNLNITWVVQPMDTPASSSISPAPAVRVLDNSGAVLSGVTISVTLGNNPGGVAFGPYQDLTNEAGVATFRALSIDTQGTGYTLVANATFPGFSDASATSNAFNVTAPIIIP